MSEGSAFATPPSGPDKKEDKQCSTSSLKITNNLIQQTKTQANNTLFRRRGDGELQLQIKYFRSEDDIVFVVPQERESGGSSSSGEKAGKAQDLRSRGLCLVPVSYTLHVTNSDNGADFWSPGTLGGSFR
eukprot:TRINITY_DN1842_c0_g1_i8.p2 TRINITY_DN1842_c0_g1~~TRINITY_DN1842_c0_g1_i8.p2  ORF type:complete len:130 (+),score=20.78 TRINITY_DN1842_c0_g1_i8:1769-2158(+)